MVIPRLFIRQIDGSGVRCYSPGVLPLLMHDARNNKVTCSREGDESSPVTTSVRRDLAGRAREGERETVKWNRITIAAEMLR